VTNVGDGMDAYNKLLRGKPGLEVNPGDVKVIVIDNESFVTWGGFTSGTCFNFFTNLEELTLKNITGGLELMMGVLAVNPVTEECEKLSIENCDLSDSSKSNRINFWRVFTAFPGLVELTFENSGASQIELEGRARGASNNFCIQFPHGVVQRINVWKN